MKVRVAVAQLDSHPAYITNTTDLAMEPIGVDFDLGAFGPILGNVREKTYALYLEQLRIRLEAVVQYCAKHQCDILVLPEYSIPPELLPLMWRLAVENAMHIVAGSHSVSSRIPKVYAQVGLQVEFTGPTSDVRKAICPILRPNGGTEQYYKMRQSQWEAYLVESEVPWEWRTITIRNQSISLGVLLCIDALIARVPESPAPPLVVIPSRSPSTKEFEDFSRLQLLNQTSVAYVNDSETGKSKIFGVYTTNNGHPFMEPDGTKPLPAGAEAVVVADLDLDHQFVHRRTVRTTLPMKLVAMAPLLYSSNSDLKAAADLLNLATEHGKTDGVETLLTCEDLPPLLADKIRRLQQLQQIGGVRAEDVAFYLSVIEIPPLAVPIDAMEHRLLTMYGEALFGVASKLRGAERTKALRSWEQIKLESEKRASKAQRFPLAESQEANTQVSTVVGTVPFQDREVHTAAARRFSNDPSKRILLVVGLRGIGKTRFCEHILQTVFPNRRAFQLRLTEGTGFPRFMHSLAQTLGVELSRQEQQSLESPEVYEQLMKKVLLAFDQLPAAVLLLDDWQHTLQKGQYKDPRFSAFIESAVARPTYRNNKIMLTSRLRFPVRSAMDATQTVELDGMDDDSIRGIIDWYVKSQRGDAEPIHVPQALVSGLHGNPLAAVIAATQWFEQSPDQAVINWPTVQERFQERLVPELLEHTDLSQEEAELMGFASLFNTEIPYEVFELYDGPGDLRGLLASLMDKFLLEFRLESQLFRVHGLVRDHFQGHLTVATRTHYHTIAADFYERKTSESTDPLFRGELVAHLAASLQYERARELRLVYYDELRPVALDLFRDKQYIESLKYYEALATFYPDDVDIHFHIALCYGHIGRWDKAEIAFDVAIAKSSNPWWVYTGYADVMIKYRHDLSGAEKYLLLALDLAKGQGVKPWKLSSVYESLGKVHLRLHRWPDAEGYLRLAVKCDPESAFPHYHLAKCLWLSGRDPREALFELDLAMSSDRTIEASERLRHVILSSQAHDRYGVQDDLDVERDLDGTGGAIEDTQ